LILTYPSQPFPHFTQVPPLMASGGVPERAGMQQQMTDPPDEPDGAAPTFMGIVNKHARFLNEVSKLQVIHTKKIKIPHK
jgi:transformation/transcription domain-associated protein